MEKIQVIVNGLPGKMARAVADAVINSDDMLFIPRSLTGPEIITKDIIVGGIPVTLYSPDEKHLATIEQADVIIDFTAPTAINENVSFYAEKKTPFVLGTTGGDLSFISNKVLESGIAAVVAPNMAREIVAFQAMMEYAANNFPDVFRDYSLEVVESHQKTKVDTSGTAKAVVASFNKLGIPFMIGQIEKKRSEADYETLGIPQEHWDGHGWHTYTFKKPDGSVFFQFTHNVNGRSVYVAGVLEAVRFLHTAIATDSTKRHGVYSMIDVLTKRV